MNKHNNLSILHTEFVKQLPFDPKIFLLFNIPMYMKVHVYNVLYEMSAYHI